MIDDTDYMIKTDDIVPETPVEVRRFPVLAQLSLLGLVLLLIFTASAIPKLLALKNGTTNTATPTEPLVTAQTTLATIPAITNVSIEGTAAFVYDVKGKKALYVKGADKVLPLASITKLMTALVAHELIADDKSITVPASAISQSGASGLTAGERISAQALSDYAMLASSNDAAYALANAVGAVIDTSDPNQTFVNAMNIRAEELGLNNFTFYNPTGLDIDTKQAGAFGTAREVTFLMEYILENYPNILEPSTFTSTRVYNEAGTYHSAENTNPIVTQIPNLLGSKTGYTDLAGGNLTVAFDAGYNRPIIITVLGSSYDGRFSDVKKLVNSVKASLQTSE
jgi:serine-type D-Ala-D-Ala carboxypeptidase (penicillin-binding protein 5/6)